MSGHVSVEILLPSLAVWCKSSHPHFVGQSSALFSLLAYWCLTHEAAMMRKNSVTHLSQDVQQTGEALRALGGSTDYAMLPPSGKDCIC